MKVTATPLEHSQVRLDIEVEPERLERAIDRAYRRIAGRVNIPGFRPGRAPRQMVERYVGRSTLVEEAIEQLLPEVYREAVAEAGLKPVALPSLEIVSAEPLQVRATVPVRPEVKLGDYRSVRVTPEAVTVTDEEEEQTLENLRRAHAEWTPVERPVQLGDRVALDVVATVDGAVVLEHRDVEFIPEAEKRDPAPGFSEAIVGLSPGESKEFTLEVPGDAANAAMAGRTVTFRVTVHGVKEEVLPPVDDEFARLVGDFETLDQLRAAVRDELRLHKERALRERLERQVVQQVVDQAEVDLPPQLVEQYARDAEEHVARSLDNQGLTIQQYIKLTGRTTTQFHEELQQQARQSLKRAFVLEAVADAEHIAVSDEEIEAEVRRLVEGEERARQALEREEIRRRIASDLREQKTVARLVDIATEGAGPIASQAASATEAAGSSQEQETDEQQ